MERERERERVFVCVRVCVCERERRGGGGQTGMDGKRRGDRQKTIRKREVRERGWGTDKRQ